MDKKKRSREEQITGLSNELREILPEEEEKQVYEDKGEMPENQSEIHQDTDQVEKTSFEPDEMNWMAAVGQTEVELMRQIMTRILLVICVLFLVVFIASRPESEPSEPVQQEETEQKGSIVVTGTLEQSGYVSPNQKKEEQTEKETGEAEETKTEFDWETAIFGEQELAVTAGTIRVNGLTSSQKEAAGFRESSFARSLSVFLEQRNLKSDQIYFKERVDISSGNAVAYKADLNQVQKSVLVIFYPDMPGNYLFLLQDQVQAEPTEVPIEAEAAGNVQTQVQASATGNTYSVQTENTYDATRLSVNRIPDTLVNYLNNRYELQYSLYEYLYRNGYRSVTSAEVADYSIDGEKREVQISLNLSDGTRLTGTYHKDTNTYTYY